MSDNIIREETLQLLNKRGYKGELTFTAVFKWLKEEKDYIIKCYYDDITFKDTTPNRWRFYGQHNKYPNLSFQSFGLFCESEEEASDIALLWFLRDSWPF